MLARVANNLFWMGRYIERSEHIARFLNVNYFSSLDAPTTESQSRQRVLRSSLFMTNTVTTSVDHLLDEQEVLFNIALNIDEPYSIINAVRNARENANSARDVLSTEFYEALNKFYHAVLRYDPNHFKVKGLFEFTTLVTESTAILREKIRGTLFHDEVYAIIMLGISVERAIQVSHIIQTKYTDALESTPNDELFERSYEWITLLKCIESHDMMRRFYKKTPDSSNVLEFLVLHPDCPRSIMNSINRLNKHILSLSMEKLPSKNSTAYLVGKTQAHMAYLSIETIEEDIQGHLTQIRETLYTIASSIEKEYFLYN
ncbi:alpha-E domain-containing protein [Nonlabens xiamenensis]|uniref:alpha-E domain-containing protein n=1 Tax=Nonlabens xiamenensis TaxID=2341043 RepID=UPI000F60EEF8|nr:alpha-E domain-containing protein [Nonlabens xiamenensis]